MTWRWAGHAHAVGRGALGALLTVSAIPASATDQELLVRAIGQLPRKELVTYLARTAQPRTILEAEHPDYGSLTYSEIAEKLCGTVHDGYLESLAVLNPEQTVDPAVVAGAKAYALKWPACFEVRKDVAYKIRKNDNPTAIRLELTGEFADGPELDLYFQPTGIDPRTAVLQPKQTLTLPFKTLKTKVLVPSDRATIFKAELRAGGGRRVQIEEPRSRGSLIGPAEGGTTLATNHDCTFDTDDRYPFNALEVANAYDDIKEPQNTVYVTVVDNGFFGVPCTASGCPSSLASDADFSPRFPKRFFAKPSFYKTYGANLGIRHILGPINYPDLEAADVNDVSGHGTHVAGLVLGGPTFEPYRQRIVDATSGAGRVALSIVAVARGTLELDSQTEARIGAAIEAMISPMLVNMSIAFDEPETEAIFQSLLRNDKILFVAAAGNDGEDLGEYRIYPAALGGKSQVNLITVASIDSTGTLSAFSNYGATADLAAPGCKIVSWLNAEGPEFPISGTSQAAPLVTFASALLLSKMQAATPRAVKNRIIYSGDIIGDTTSRARIWSGTQLNIPKALFLKDDFVSFRDGQGLAAYLGQIERFIGVTCGDKERSFDDIRSLKRVSEAEVWVYTETASGPVSVCSGKLADRTLADPTVEVTLSFKPRARLQGASIVPVDPTAPPLPPIKARDLVELVRGLPSD